MSRSLLIDTTRCIGCRGCQVACKQSNGLPAEQTEFFGAEGGYQNPAALSSKTFSLVTFTELVDDQGELNWVFTRRQCMHCLEPSCASACIVGALQRSEDGSVVYDENKCIGCRYCMIACPFGIPTLEWEKPVALIRKCTFCTDRQADAAPPETINDKPLADDSAARQVAGKTMPACAKTCPTGAILFGDRDELLAIAHARINAEPDKYVHHVYGEHEAGGTGVLYLSSVDFKELGLPANTGTKPFPAYSHAAKAAVPPLILGVGALLAGSYWFHDRKKKVSGSNDDGHAGHDGKGA